MALAEKFTDVEDFGQHFWLRESDECYFLGEFTASGGYQESETNQLILNIKKSPSRVGRPEYKYKQSGIIECSTALRGAMNLNWARENSTIVPIPPSRSVDDSEYDDRLLQILRGIDSELDVRELVRQCVSTTPSHLAVQQGSSRLKPDDLRKIYKIDESLTSPEPSHILIFDDVLTAGAHFRAMSDILSERFTHADIAGFFIARTVRPNSEYDL